MAGDQRLLKQLNRMALVRAVKETPGTSRVELAARTGLTKSTVSVLVGELVEEGWLTEGLAPAAAVLGRRRTPLRLDPGRLALIGAELGIGYLNTLGCNLEGAVLWERLVPFHHQAVEASVAALTAEIAEARRALADRGCRPLGAGVSVPGTMDLRDGALRFAPNIGWQDVPITGLLRAALAGAGCEALALRILNDANAAALGHHVFGAAHAPGPLVYLSAGVGLGAGIVLGDRLYRGNDGMAGEVGHTVLHPEGPPCTCGRRGCAETFVSQRALTRALTGRDTPILSIQAIQGRLASGDPAAERAVARAGDYLGMLMQNLCNTVNPAVIVVGGPLAQLGDRLLQPAVASMHARAGRYDYHRVKVERCPFGLDACALGAASSVFHDFLHPPEAARADGTGAAGPEPV